MRTNKLSIGGLRGVYVSSIGNWGYEANFKAVYFFLRKDSARIKTLTNKKPTNKTKTSKQKNNKGDNFLRAQFSKRVKVACFTFGAFYALKIFSWKKKKKQVQNYLRNLNYIYYNNSSKFNFLDSLQTNLKAPSWLLFILCCIFLLWNNQVRGTRKFYIRRNNNKFDSIETGRIVIAHLLAWSDLEKYMYTTLF